MKPFAPTPPPFENQERALRALEWVENVRRSAVTAARLLSPLERGVWEHLAADDLATRAAELAERIRSRITSLAQEGAETS